MGRSLLIVTTCRMATLQRVGLATEHVEANPPYARYKQTKLSEVLAVFQNLYQKLQRRAYPPKSFEVIQSIFEVIGGIHETAGTFDMPTSYQ